MNCLLSGSGFYVEVEVKYFHPAALFVPVDHGLQNDLGYYHGNQDVLRDHCPYPVPSKYDLYYTTHKVYLTAVLFIMAQLSCPGIKCFGAYFTLACLYVCHQLRSLS